MITNNRQEPSDGGDVHGLFLQRDRPGGVIWIEKKAGLRKILLGVACGTSEASILMTLGTAFQDIWCGFR